MKRSFIVITTLVFLYGAVCTAEAGWLSTILKGAGGKAGTSTSKGMATTGAKTVAKKEAIKGAVGAGAVGLLLGAGLASNPSQAEQAEVEEEIRVAIGNREPVYYAKVCLHPQKQEFYTVPQWAEYCPDGSTPKRSEGIDLTSQY